MKSKFLNFNSNINYGFKLTCDIFFFSKSNISTMSHLPFGKL